MDSRVTAVITVDLLPTFCPRANWARVTTEGTAMSLSSCSWMLSQLSPVGGGEQKRTPHFLSKGRTQFCWSCSRKVDMTLLCFSSASLVNGNKNCAASAIMFCLDGYYKLTGTNGCWLEHYFIGKGMTSKGSWLQSILDSTKKPQSPACMSKIKCFKILQLHSTTVFMSWCELDTLKVICGVHDI